MKSKESEFDYLDVASSYYQSGGMANPAYLGSTEKSHHDSVLVPMTGAAAHPGVSVDYDQPKWSWCSTGWSCFTYCFCPISAGCGFLGVLCSVLSYTDHKSGDYDRSSYKRKWAWCCSMFGLLLSLLLIIGVVLAFVVFGNRLAALGCPGYQPTTVVDVWGMFCALHGYRQAYGQH